MGVAIVPKLWIVPSFELPENANDPASLKSPSKTPDVPFASEPALPALAKYSAPDAVTVLTAWAMIPS